jgi:glucose-6-phosphate 1-epimerase
MRFQGHEAIGLLVPDGSKAVVMRQGAQVVSWVSAAGVEQLYLSPLAHWGPGQAVRGGIPVIFPQFGDCGPGRRHGFVRTADWAVHTLQAEGDSAQVTLMLASDPPTLALWPHAFQCELSVVLTPNMLRLTLRVANTDDVPFSFTAALHSYLRVGSLDSVLLSGLQQVSFEDALQAGALSRVDQRAVLRVNGPVDRIYYDAPRVLHLHSASCTLQWQARGFRDAVVWNPGEQAASDLADLPAGDYRQFLCVEAAAIGRPVRLESCGQWCGSQTLLAV